MLFFRFTLLDLLIIKNKSFINYSETIRRSPWFKSKYLKFILVFLWFLCEVVAKQNIHEQEEINITRFKGTIS
jgi:hypothetical protein